MNRLNSQCLQDQDRYIRLRTDFAKARFWRLKKRLGHKYWSKLRKVVDGNVRGDDVCCNAFAMVGFIRKSEMERWERTRDARNASNRAYALELARQDRERQKLSETSVVEDDTGVMHVGFGRKRMP
jgi:hypothetical protein